MTLCSNSFLSNCSKEAQKALNSAWTAGRSDPKVRKTMEKLLPWQGFVQALCPCLSKAIKEGRSTPNQSDGRSWQDLQPNQRRLLSSAKISWWLVQSGEMLDKCKRWLRTSGCMMHSNLLDAKKSFRPQNPVRQSGHFRVHTQFPELDWAIELDEVGHWGSDTMPVPTIRPCICSCAAIFS